MYHSKDDKEYLPVSRKSFSGCSMLGEQPWGKIIQSCQYYSAIQIILRSISIFSFD